MNSRALVSTSLRLAIISLMVRAVSFFREMLIASRLGASNSSDIFVAGSTIIGLFASMLCSPFAASYLPYASEAHNHKDAQYRSAFFAKVYQQAVLAGLFQVAFVILTSSFLSRLFAPGFSQDDLAVLRIVLLCQSPVLLFQMLIVINNANYQVDGRFGMAEVLSAVPYLCVIAYMFFSGEGNIIHMSIAVSIGYLLVWMLQIRYIRTRFCQSLHTTSNDIKLAPMFKTAAAFLVTTAVRQLNLGVNQVLASGLGSGTVTMLSYANKVSITEVGLISVAISTVIYASVARTANEGDSDGNRTLLKSAIDTVIVLLIPVTVITVAFSHEIIDTLFRRGAFTAEAVSETASLLSLYALGMVAFGLQDVLVRTCFAFKIARYSVISSIVLVAINVILAYILHLVVGASGLAIASSVAVIAIIPYLALSCHKRVVRIDFIHHGRTVLLSLAISGVGTALAAIVRTTLHHSGFEMNWIVLLSSLLAFLVVYLILGYLFRVEVIDQLISTVLFKKRRETE